MKLYDGKKVAEVRITWIEGGEELDVEEERIDEVLLDVTYMDLVKLDPFTGEAFPIRALPMYGDQWGWETAYRVDDIERHIGHAMDWLEGGISCGDLGRYDPSDEGWTVKIERI